MGGVLRARADRALRLRLISLADSNAALRAASQHGVGLNVQIFHRFNELIEDHYLQHWPLSRYADGIGVTEARLNDVCRRRSIPRTSIRLATLAHTITSTNPETMIRI